MKDDEMKIKLMKFLCCPKEKCKNELLLSASKRDGNEIEEGTLTCKKCKKIYKITSGIPRFVECDEYAATFSYEWKFAKSALIDSFNKRKDAETRFAYGIDFPLSELRNKIVIDAGCGSGRYTDIASKFGAEVIAVDISYSVNIGNEFLGKRENINFIQADIMNLPLKDSIADLIFSFGVLHHMPSTENAFYRLPRLLKRNGKLAISLYSEYEKAVVYPTRFWQRIIGRMPLKIQFYIAHLSVPFWYLWRIRYIGWPFQVLLPIPMDKDWRTRVLEMFDWYSPKYSHMHNHWEVYKWYENAGFEKIKVLPNAVSYIGQIK